MKTGTFKQEVLLSMCDHVEYLIVFGNGQWAMHTRIKTTAVHFAGCYFPHGYVEAVLFTEHFAGCYFPRGFTIFVFISLDRQH